MDKHAQQPTPSQPDVEKEIIAANALNEGATQPYDDPNVAEAQAQQRSPHGIGHGEEVDGMGSQQFADGGEVEKQVTRRSIRSGKAVSVNNVAAIPNGGTKAWLQVLGAFFLFFNSWGIINTFGAYQTYYQSGILASSSPSDISWIGSVQA
ncbi:hypothetical protein VTO58DRAFT_105307, partial [Aureobasidium pullulans]